MAVFARYTEESRRAIFFARQTALLTNSATINSEHFFLGLLSEAQTRADQVFHLRAVFPIEADQQSTLAEQKPVKENIPLTTDLKRVIAYVALEADSLHDYWIDTDHLVLGILREDENAAANKLRSTGLDIETARRRVIEGKSSRPERPHPVIWWVRRRPLGIALSVAFVIGVLVALYLLGVVGGRQ
jgi:ATP-dependent Clp protease ATP-binding subunit ClpC